jgi:hypothetical protein
MPETEPTSLENANPERPDFSSLGKSDRLATLSWYLVVTGMVLLGFAALCLYLDRTGYRDFFKHKDFALNPLVLSRRLLVAGILSYAAGRIITYSRRFSKRPKA